VAFDCGLIGPLGYSADVSRTFRCGPGRPTEKQRTLYKLAYENIQQSLALIKPGITFKELSD
jgi:Xaa-Pro dipeptidase